MCRGWKKRRMLSRPVLSLVPSLVDGLVGRIIDELAASYPGRPRVIVRAGWSRW